jgi:hypothetical protein
MAVEVGKGQEAARRVEVGALVAVVLALLALVPAGASASSDPCTQTGSNLTGGSGRDVLCGTGGADTLTGGGGNDELRGGSGDDTLLGGHGNDTIAGNGGADKLMGGPGSDTLNGGAGVDVYDGGSGGDELAMRDGELDDINALRCGDGDDLAEMDLADSSIYFFDVGGTLFRANLIFSCEFVDFLAVREGPTVGLSRRPLGIGSDGRTSVRMHCPRSLSSRCKGTLTLGIVTRAKRSHPATRYTIRPGHSLGVSVALNRHDRRALRRSHRAKGTVVAVEKGRFGKKTTTATVTLRAR